MSNFDNFSRWISRIEEINWKKKYSENEPTVERLLPPKHYVLQEEQQKSETHEILQLSIRNTDDKRYI
jgi:hypothetical protein